MALSLPTLRVADPLRHEALSVFPLFAEPGDDVEYRLSEEAFADESLLVEEVSEGGSVPDLLVENKGDQRVLFLEGEELIGAKQNRILNTSVLVAAHSKLKIPVSCVEAHRWRYTSHGFRSSGSHSPSKLRQSLKASVNRSLKEKRGYRSDQGEVWREVDELHAAHGVTSGTAAMSDAFETHQDQINVFREKLRYVDQAVGVAVAVGGRVVSVDVFDKPATCRKVWDRLLSGVVFDALAAAEAKAEATVTDVEQLLATASGMQWEQTEPVGEGEEYRAESQAGEHASALALGNTVVHESVLAAV